MRELNLAQIKVPSVGLSNQGELPSKDYRLSVTIQITNNNNNTVRWHGQSPSAPLRSDGILALWLCGVAYGFGRRVRKSKSESECGSSSLTSACGVGLINVARFLSIQ